MDRVFDKGAAASPPSPPATPSIGYPTGGDPATGQMPTQPGPYWFHQITEELRNAIVAGGLTPDHTQLTQLRDAINALIAQNAIPATDKGAPGGVATLDPVTGLLAANQFGASYLAPNGYQIMPSGLILQWMRVTSTIAGFEYFLFPISFPNALLSVASVKDQLGYGMVDLTIDLNGSTANALHAAHQYTSINSYISGFTSRIIAIGY